MNDIVCHGWKTIIRAGSISIVLRAVTLLSKFLLVFFLAKYFHPQEVGVFGIFVATISLTLYVLGVDFYTFNTREILSKEKCEQACLIRDQFVFHSLVYILVLPLLIFVFVYDFLEWKYIGWFYVLLIMEHLSQELYRILIVLSRPVRANFVLFLRSGAWVYLVTTAFYADQQSRDLSVVWFGWAIGVGLSLVAAAYWLRDLSWHVARKTTINWKWIKRGLLVSLPFLASSLALRAIFTIDRYILKGYWGNETVGAYIFYANIGNALSAFVDAGIVAALYPKIIRAYQQNNIEKYHQLMRDLAYGIVITSTLISAIFAISIDSILDYIDHRIYVEHKDSFWVILLAMVTMSLGMIPHFGLYVKHRDKMIILSTISGLAVSVLVSLLLIPEYGPLGAALGVLCAMLVIGLFKGIGLYIDK